jgi:Fic family protein
VVYTPPRGAGLVEDLIDNLCDFINDDETYPIDALIKMAIAHYQFEVIHPFPDGNGRTGRMMNSHILVHKGWLDQPILYLSRYIIEHKNEYYSLLASVSQRGNWEGWILFMLDAVDAICIRAYRQINDIMDSKEATRHYIETNTKIQKAGELVENLYSLPYIKVRNLTDKKLYAENTARNYLNELTRLGVLTKQAYRGHDYYINRDLMRILAYA